MLNGGQYLEQTLDGLAKRIKDISAIHLLDGPWEHSGFDELRSTDNTADIIAAFAAKHDGIEVVFDSPGIRFRNPPHKRNYQMKLIDDLWGEEPYTIMWFDDDEEIRFTTGLEEIWVRDSIITLSQVVVVPTYAWDSNVRMNTIRFIPSKSYFGHKYHWHTGMAMILHDEHCKMVLDWRVGSKYNEFQTNGDFHQNFYTKFVHMWNEFYFVNKWNRRDLETTKKRIAFSVKEQEIFKQNPECEFQKVGYN